MTGLLYGFVALGSLLLGAFAATAHQSLRDMPRGRLEERIKNNGIGAKKNQLRAILDAELEHAAAAALPRIVAHLVTALSMVAWVSYLRHPEGEITLVDAGIGAVIAGLAIWVVGVALPISLAEHAGASVVTALSGPIRLAYFLATPLRLATRWMDRIVASVAGTAGRSASEELEVELRSVVEEGERGGGIDVDEREMIEAVVKFRSTSVERIMTPRTHVNAFAYTDDLAEVLNGVINVGHSRIPVYEDNLDHVAGVLYAKDLLGWLARATDEERLGFQLRPLLREAHFVPETKMVRDLLSELLERKVHLTMVADEYGGTSGLVTLEDIIEEVFGDIRDEYDMGEVEVESLTSTDPETGTINADARVRIDDLNDILEDFHIEIPDGSEYDTLGGFVVTTLGRIPPAGECLHTEGLDIEVVEADAARVVRLRLKPAAVFEVADENAGSLEPGATEGDESEPGTEKSASASSDG